MKYQLSNMILAFLSGCLLVLTVVLWLLGHDPIPYCSMTFIAFILGFWEHQDTEDK